eukprot:485061_1
MIYLIHLEIKYLSICIILRILAFALDVIINKYDSQFKATLSKFNAYDINQLNFRFMDVNQCNFIVSSLPHTNTLIPPLSPSYDDSHQAYIYLHINKCTNVK